MSKTVDLSYSMLLIIIENIQQENLEAAQKPSQYSSPLIRKFRVTEPVWILYQYFEQQKLTFI